jgi:hypothetical protein
MTDVMRYTTKIITVSVLLLGLGGCATTMSGDATDTVSATTAASAEDIKAEPGTLLIMTEREEGSEPFTTRIFVNPGYLHLSDSRSPADYILFNRKEQTIYNVTQADRTIMVIKKKPIDIEPPIALNYEEVSQPSNAIPKINGRQATHYRFMANGQHCYDAVVLPEDFMPDVLMAMRDFRQILAGEHATTIDRIPKDLLDPCDLSLNVFHAVKHMDHGLPIREWDRHGYQRFMKDYREGVTAGEGTLDLPEDFRRYAIGDELAAQKGDDKTNENK